jgi:hypothetical protein
MSSSAPRAAGRPAIAVLALLFAAAAGSAFAQARPSTVRMSCAQARGLVASHGAIVLGTGGQTFDRYVNHRGFCLSTEITDPTWVPAGDTPQCFIGYRCVDPGPWLAR